MSDPYEELFKGDLCLRLPPSARHEEICQRLHDRVAVSMTEASAARLLPPRTKFELSTGIALCPDLALATTTTGKLWLAAEIINSGDHSADIVIKKGYYEEAGLPRLWMIDPRYDNVEIYHGGKHGLILKEILAVKEVLTEPLLPGFRYVVDELFKA